MNVQNQFHEEFDNKKSSNVASIPLSIGAIGFAGMMLNMSSAMVFSLSAIYLKTVLGVATMWIGLLEGVVEACAYAVKVFSGVLSDYFKKRKLIIVIGFAFATFARPILALSSSFSAVFISRILDRIGNGVQSTPRDALIGDISPPSIKGECYGLRQSLATAGSFLAGIVGVVAMRATNTDFKLVFWIAAIPALLGLLILLIFVKDKIPSELDEQNSARELGGHAAEHAEKRHPIHLSDLGRLGKGYWLLMIVVAVFMLARVSESFLILHAHSNFGLSADWSPLVLMLYNGSNALASYPIGKLSDKIGRYKLLAMGILLLSLSDGFLSLSSALPFMMFGVVLWGIQIGITQSMFTALVADLVPADLRGTGFGIFHLINSVSLIVAGYVGGSIANKYGEAKMFAASGMVGLAALVTLFIVLRINGKRVNVK